MNFSVYGPWKLPRKNGIIDCSNAAKRLFWSEVEESVEGLSTACGCYIFSMQKKPWYVGMACKQTLAKESFSDQKINLYNQALRTYSKATPYLFLLPKLTESGKFVKLSKNGQKDIAFLESMLIGLAIRRNPELLNIRGTKFLKELNVPGIINTKKGQARSLDVQSLRKILNI